MLKKLFKRSNKNIIEFIKSPDADGAIHAALTRKYGIPKTGAAGVRRLEDVEAIIKALLNRAGSY